MSRVDHRMRAPGLKWALTLLLTFTYTTGCNFDVTNPGPVQDSQLNDPAAQTALVNGAGRLLSAAVGWVAYTGGVAALEVQGSGNITQFGVTLKQRDGDLAPEQAETDEHWQRSQAARWVAEESVNRMRNVLGGEFSSEPLAAQALLYAGYSNRLLGENMCVAVIDAGPQQSRIVHFERAKAAFTEAIDIAGAAGEPELQNAARAGRASVNVWLDDWAGVEADAGAVPQDFVYSIAYSDIEVEQYNRIYWAGASSPFRAVTVWSTYFEQYYQDTNDPRTPWTTVEGFPTGDGSTVPFYRQMKYDSRTTPIRLSTGREMQLLLAEARLRTGDWPGATTIMNNLRAELSLPAESPADLTETWNLLRRERGAELWLEARTLGDVFRWEEDAVPGTHYQDLSGRDRCFPVGQSELDTNPNEGA
jgi:starch-binding outer membrane protein, SusD/RagB family